MKRLNLYRLLVVLLTLCLGFSLFLYKQKNCVVVKNETKKIVNPNYVFLGDSITYLYDLDKYFEGFPVVDSGINGNRTQDILDNLEERVYRYNPSKVILLIGINDFLYGNHDADEITGNIEKISLEIQKNLPNCKIYIESIYPINDDWRLKHNSSVPRQEELKEKILNANKKIKEISTKNKYIYINIHDELIDEKGYFKSDYTNDGLHPNEEGYKVITKHLKKVLDF